MVIILERRHLACMSVARREHLSPQRCRARRGGAESFHTLLNSFYEQRNVFPREQRQSIEIHFHRQSGAPLVELLSSTGSVRIVKRGKVDRGGLCQGPPSRRFHPILPSARAHDREISLDKIKKAVAFHDDTRGLHSRKGLLDSVFDLLFAGDHPVHIRGARVPKAAGVFSGFVILFAPRANQRFVTNQIADTTAKRVLPAGTIMPAGQFDRFPTRQTLEEITHQRGLAGVCRPSADGNYGWPL